MAQFGRPISDLQNTSITGGFGDIDETSASDSDFLYSADNTDTVYECGLTASLSDPLTGDSHTFRYRIAETDGGVLGDGAGNGTVTIATSLRQGATVIATDTTRNCTNAWTTHTLTITTGEADNITDYTDLRLYFDIVSPTGGAPGGRRGGGVSWAELEAPERITSFDEEITLTSDNTTTELGEVDFLSTLTLTSDNSVTNSGGLNVDKSLTLTTDNTFTDSLELFIDKSITLTSDNLAGEDQTLDMSPTVSLTSDNTTTELGEVDFLSTLTLTSDNTINNTVGLSIDKSLTLTTDNTFTDNLELFIDKVVTLTTDNIINQNETLDMSPTVSLTIDNIVGEDSIMTIDDNITENIDILDIYIGNKDFSESLVLTSDVSINNASNVSSIYNESITLNSLFKLQTTPRKSDLFTIININKITGIGKITGQ